MQISSRPSHGRLVVSVALTGLLSASTAFAQVDISGDWATRTNEDQPHRGPGADLGDYTGLPINAAARQKASSWDASILSGPESMAKPHAAQYFMRGPGPNLRVQKVNGPTTQELIAYTIEGVFGRNDRVIWMDGRPHPSPLAGHTFMGFSTGRWEGDTLVATTTHIKQGWHRRSGVPQSDRTTMVERFSLYGNVLTYTSITDDPVYLTEPLVKTVNILKNPRPLPPQQLLYPCQAVVEIADQPRGAVPHYLPGENPYLKEYGRQFNIPDEAMRGGAATMYPEFRANLK
jgi:hypothetical protein